LRKYPYKIHPCPDGFYFITKSKIKYKVIFFTTNDLWDTHPEIKKLIFDFSFSPTKETAKPDIRVSITIIIILKKFFKRYPNHIITYVCDSSDGKELSRFKLFHKWYDENSSGTDYHKENHTHRGENNFCAGMIMKNSNPHKEAGIKAFKETMGIYLLYGLID
jgi:hypothetical protein